MPFFADRGFYKRAQIAANDLHLAGVADFPDIDRLTIFADNLVPARAAPRRRPALLGRARRAHRRRHRAARRRPSSSSELRACAVHACEVLAAPRRRPARDARQLALEPRPAPALQRAAARTSPAPCTTEPMDAFEGIVGDLEYPMFIVTARADDGEPLGCLVGFTTQSSIDPPRFIACLSHNNRTYRRGRDAAVLGVHAVPADAADLAELFGGETGDEVDKFARCAWHEGPERRADPRPLRELVRRPRARALRRRRPRRVPARAARRRIRRRRTSSRSTARSGSIPVTRPDSRSDV